MDSLLNLRFPGKVTTINSGASGQCSRYGVQNLRTRVLDQLPDAVFIEFAINDDASQLNLSLDSARINLNTMIDSIVFYRPNCQIILQTMNPTTATNRDSLEYYYQMYRDVAAERHLLLVDNYLKWKPVFDNDRPLFLSLVPDGLHPNSEGSRQITTPTIMDALEPTNDTTGIESGSRLALPILQSFPNPFHAAVKINTPPFFYSERGKWSLKIYNSSGRMVADLSSKIVRSHLVEWTPRDLPTGIYFIRCMSSNDFRAYTTSTGTIIRQ